MLSMLKRIVEPLRTKTNEVASEVAWVEVLHDVATTLLNIDARLAQELCVSPGLKRHAVQTLGLTEDPFADYFAVASISEKNDKKIPTADDFAVATAFEMEHSVFFRDKPNDLAEIENFAAMVRRKWLLRIDETPSLKTQFIQAHSQHPVEALLADAVCSPCIKGVLSDKVKLQKTYFESYSTPGAPEQVVVWLPGEHNAVEWKREMSVEVLLGPEHGADLGFYRQGFDYSISDCGGHEGKRWLQAAYLDNKRFLEIGLFGSFDVNSIKGPVLWCN